MQALAVKETTDNNEEEFSTILRGGEVELQSQDGDMADNLYPAVNRDDRRSTIEDSERSGTDGRRSVNPC